MKSSVACFFNSISNIFNVHHFSMYMKGSQSFEVGSFTVGVDTGFAIFGYICRYQKALYFGSLGISLYLELFCFLSFISFVLHKLT